MHTAVRKVFGLALSLLFAGVAHASLALPSGDYDMVVIGGGPAGNVSALRLAQAGKRVLIVEKRTADRARRQIVGIKQLSADTLHRIEVGLDPSRNARYAPRPDAAPHSEPETPAHENAVKHMTEAFSTHTITIGDLETHLLAAS